MKKLTKSEIKERIKNRATGHSVNAKCKSINRMFDRHSDIRAYVSGLDILVVQDEKVIDRIL